ncbi:MAG: TolC family protein [Flavobacteriales bacterium]
MTNVNIGWLIALWLGGLINVSAQDQSRFSLDEAIDYALQHNRTAISAQKSIQAAYKQKWETTSIGLPQISAKASYNYWLKRQKMVIPANAFDPSAPPGETTQLTFVTPQTLNADITVSQKLFDGSYLVGLQSAKVFLEISKHAKTKTDLQIREQVINAYGNVLMSEASIDITKSNIKTLKSNLFETQEMFVNGFIEEENVEQLQLTLASLESNLKHVERLGNLAYKMLNIVLGRDIQSTLVLSDKLEQLSAQSIDIDMANKTLGLKNNIDFLIAQNNLKSKALLLKLEESKSLPQLSAFFQSALSGNGNDFDQTVNTANMVPSNLLGFNLNLPVFSSFGRTAAVQRKRIELDQAELQVDDLEQQLQLQLTQAQSDYLLAIDQLQTSKERLSLAERIEGKNQIKFSEGLSSSFDLRQAQNQLYSTQQDYIQAMQNLISKKATLETLINK